MPDAEGHPSAIEMELGSVLAALSDPMRRRVVAELAREPDGVERTCASFGLPVSKASLTYHFRVLREAGLIRQVDHGNRRSTTLRRHDVNDRFPGLLALIVSDVPAGVKLSDRQTALRR